MSEIFFCSNRIVDAWNSLPNTVLFASSTSNFEMKLRDVNKLTIVEWFYSYLCIYFFGIVLYFYVYFIYVLAAYQWPSGLICLFEMKWNERSIEHTDWRFFPNFMPICVPLQRNATLLYPLQNHAPFSPPFCAPLAQGAKISKTWHMSSA